MGLPLPFSIGHEVKFPLLFRLVEKEPKKGSDTQGRLCAKKESQLFGSGKAEEGLSDERFGRGLEDSGYIKTRVH
jgi:hypothetical protein